MLFAIWALLSAVQLTETSTASENKVLVSWDCSDEVLKNLTQKMDHLDDIHGAAWTIVQRRQDGSTNFYRDWAEYQHGFGNLEGEYFLGLDKLHALTQSTLHELWIQLEDFENASSWAKYSSFAVGSANESYALNVLGTYTGDAGDSFAMHAGQKFTTPDVDNDQHELLNCAVEYTGGWWYAKCHESNLNGQHLKGALPVEKFGKGIIWYKFRQHYYSLKYVHMAIRPVSSEK